MANPGGSQTVPGRGRAAGRSHNPLKNGLERRVLHPGDYQCSSRPIVLSTLLGSCVSACLYDPVAGTMGMNHFLLAQRNRQDAELLASDEGRYGINAMELLINGLLKLGANRRRLCAKVFGGANVLSGSQGEGLYNIGSVNVRFVREFLARERIPILAEDLGGSRARQIHFTAPDYSVYLRRIESSIDDLVARERRYIDRRREENARAASNANVEFW